MFRKYYRPYSVNANYNNKMYMPYARDYGAEPFATNIKEITMKNDNFRTALWTGEHLQITLMCIKVGECIGLERHSDLDQFIAIEQGIGLVQMGNDRNNLNFQAKVHEDCVFVIPAGKWHNLTNIGEKPIKLYSIYALPQHLKGIVHRTKEEEEASKR